MSKSKLKKDSKGKVPSVKDEPLHVEEDVPLVPPDIKHVHVKLLGFTHITPTFSVSELTVQGQFVTNELGVSGKTLVTDDEYLEANHDFIIECNVNSYKELDELISNPVILCLIETPGEPDGELITRLPPKHQPTDITLMSADSACELSEALTGKVVDKSTFVTPDTSDKGGNKESDKTGVKGKPDVKKSKSDLKKLGKDKTSKTKLDDTTVESEGPMGPILVGTATLDLLPLFLGQTEINERLLVHKPKKVFDESIVPVNIMPRIAVLVTVEEGTLVSTTGTSNILSLTIESIYNIPQLMNEEMQYKVCTILPFMSGQWVPIVIAGGKLTEKIELEKIKRWPGMVKDNSLENATKYSIDENLDTIKNQFNLNLEIVNKQKPRIEWNVIKRNFMDEVSFIEFYKKLRKYRRIALEVYITSAKDEAEAADNSTSPKPSKSKTKSDASSKSDKGKKGGKGATITEEIENYLHLIAIIDVSTLLYPGVSRCRVACPFNTYQEKEVFELTGLEDSFFMPRPPPVEVVPEKVGGKGKGDKASASSKSDKKAPINDNKNDLKPLLPPPPPPEPDPSTPVYNEKGEQTFIIVEIELLYPLMPKRDLEDLSEQFQSLIQEKPPMPKVAISSQLAEAYYRDAVEQLNEDLTLQFKRYVYDKENCQCDGENQVDFITLLRKNGAYQTYLTTITKAATIIANDRFPYTGEISRSCKEYQHYIASIYAYLVKEMNSVLNQFTIEGAEKSYKSQLRKLDPLLLYAREATEIGANILANRYYLERISQDERNANSWFDYSIFYLELQQKEVALNCVKEALAVNTNHQYSLLLYGIMLTEKEMYEEAETCLLTAMFQNPSWVEGWGTTHLFYAHIGNEEGADLCLEMANKYVNTAHVEKNYFTDIDDLVWSSSIAPNTVFFRTAIFLLKLRMFEFAEKALAHEVIKHSGICHYFLAVIKYYRQEYENALVDLGDAERLHGIDYRVASLYGHCYLALEKLDLAKDHYLFVMESFNRPEDMHLVFVYLALIWERLENKTAARKLLLLVCRYSPTPYTWLACGLIYFAQKDMLTAEQCLMQSNICDNTLPEPWAFLTLINIELSRFSEAELCYREAMKNKLNNKDIISAIQDAWMKSKNCL